MFKTILKLAVLFFVFVCTGCTAIKEGLSYKRVYNELSEISFKFHSKEKISYGVDVREYYLKFTPKLVTSSEVIFFIHGGGWKSGTPEEFEYLADYFVNKGYRVVLAGYPLVPDVNLAEMNSSITKCFLEVYKDFNSVEYTTFTLGGASAGSHLAANLYFKSLNDFEPEKDAIKSLFSLSGVLDFKMCKNGIIKSLIHGISDIPSNPVELLKSESDLPLFLLFSVSDGVVEYENSLSFARKAETFGHDVTLLKYDNYRHDEAYVYPFLYGDSKISLFESWLANND